MERDRYRETETDRDRDRERGSPENNAHRTTDYIQIQTILQ